MFKFKRILSCSIITILMLTGVSCASSSSDTPIVKTKTKTKIKSNKGIAKNDLEKKIIVITEKALGVSTNTKEQKVVEINNANDYVDIVINADDNFSIKKSAWLETKNLMKAIAKKSTKSSDFDLLKDFAVTYKFPLRSTDGNVSNEKVMKVTFTMDVIKKSDWDNVVTEDVSKLAKSYWEHKALKEN